MDVYLYLNRGGKEINQDAAGYEIKDSSAIFIVADGLGGHQYGEISSNCAVQTLLDSWRNSDKDPGHLDKWLQKQIRTVNQKILEMQRTYQCTMKTTLVALLLENNKAVWANTGDSRLYYFHDKIMESVTEDHSVAYKKYKAGEITRNQIGMDEDQPCLLRSLGGINRYEPDLHTLNRQIEKGDAFLLCTDGAWEYLRDEEILFDLLKAKSAKEWVEFLLLRVISRIQEGNDNLTLLAIMIN